MYEVKVNLIEFKSTLENVSKILHKKMSLDILECVKVSIENRVMYLLGNDLEKQIKGKICCKSNSDKSCEFILSDVAKLKKAIGYFKGKDLILQSYNIGNMACVRIFCGDKELILKSFYKVKDFPYTNYTCSFDTYKTMSKDFVRRINKVKNSVAKENTKPILTGFHFNKNDIVTVDGYRISVSSGDLNIQPEITIPKDTIYLVQKVIGQGNKNLCVDIDRELKNVRFIYDNICVESKLLDGEFLRYDNSLFSLGDKSIILSTKDFLNSIKYLKEFVEKHRREPLLFIINNNELELSLLSDSGEFKSRLQIDYVGDKLTVAFNIEYIYDFLSVIDDEEVELYFKDSPRPMICKTSKEKYLVLPLRLNK